MAVKGITLEIWKGDARKFRFFVDDISTLVDYEAFFYLSVLPAGTPILTKTSSPAAGIVIETTDRFIDVEFTVADFDYSSSIVAGTYAFELRLIYNGTIPRLVGSGNLIVNDSVVQHI